MWEPMIENDTVRLLRECDAGATMGADSIGDVLADVESPAMKRTLSVCKDEHDSISGEIRARLPRCGAAGKKPGVVAEAMSRAGTWVKLQMDRSDSTIAERMTDGCNMGVKSLSRYLNQYAAADAPSRDTAERLIRLEAKLAEDLRGYL